MAFEATGTLHTIFETKDITQRFRKREFVVETADNPKYPQTILFQVTGDRCDALDEYSQGDTVRMTFDIRGREWKSPKGEIKFFNSLEVFRIERESGAGAPAAGDGPPPIDDDDIPF